MSDDRKRKWWDLNFWVDSLGLQSVLFALLTVVSAIILLVVTLFMFPNACTTGA